MKGDFLVIICTGVKILKRTYKLPYNSPEEVQQITCLIKGVQLFAAN